MSESSEPKQNLDVSINSETKQKQNLDNSVNSDLSQSPGRLRADRVNPVNGLPYGQKIKLDKIQIQESNPEENVWSVTALLKWRARGS